MAKNGTRLLSPSWIFINTGSPAWSCSRMSRANNSMVPPRKRAERGSFFPVTLSTSTSTRAPIRECPPRSKKSSRIPILLVPRTLRHIFSSVTSSSSLGSTRPERSKSDVSGAGRSRRLIFPFGLRGSCCNSRIAVGTMYSGNFARIASCKAAAEIDFPDGTTYATRRLSPGVSSRAVTTAD